MPTPNVKCQNCRIARLCLPVMLAESEVEHLDSIIQRGKALKKGELLFRAGDTFHDMFAVRSGCVKSYTISPDGEEQITGFHLPGEIVGLDAISSGKHPGFAKALMPSAMCTIPYGQLQDLSGYILGLREQLMRVMSREIMEDRELLLLLNQKSADQRLAAFLINLAARYNQRGLSGSRFHLVMTRSDIANYLGLALETVSRLLHRFNNQGLIELKHREVTLLKTDELSGLAGTSCHVTERTLAV